MACQDEASHTFENVAAGQTYKLSFDGPAGTFSDRTTFDGAFRPPGNKTEPLNAPPNFHMAIIGVAFISPDVVSVKVAATVDGQSYCREVTGKAPESTMIFHRIRLS